MISRRLARVKAMQAVYALKQDAEADADHQRKRLGQAMGDITREAWYLVYTIGQVAEYCRIDHDNKQQKLLKNEGDDLGSTALPDSELVSLMVEDEDIQRLLKRHALIGRLDKDLVKALFLAMRDRSFYQTFLQSGDALKACRKLLHKILDDSELFYEHMEEVFPAWHSDHQVAVAGADNLLRALAEKRPTKELETSGAEAHAFGLALYDKTLRHWSATAESIVPFLSNWDPSRVARMDMICLHLAITELCHFPQIPIRVTLDEYLDISKLYSTPRSFEFLNGVLDGMVKQLSADGQIKKEGRGLI